MSKATPPVRRERRWGKRADQCQVSRMLAHGVARTLFLLVSLVAAAGPGCKQPRGRDHESLRSAEPTGPTISEIGPDEALLTLYFSDQPECSRVAVDAPGFSKTITDFPLRVAVPAGKLVQVHASAPGYYSFGQDFRFRGAADRQAEVSIALRPKESWHRSGLKLSDLPRDSGFLRAEPDGSGTPDPIAFKKSGLMIDEAGIVYRGVDLPPGTESSSRGYTAVGRIRPDVLVNMKALRASAKEGDFERMPGCQWSCDDCLSPTVDVRSEAINNWTPQVIGRNSCEIRSSPSARTIVAWLEAVDLARECMEKNPDMPSSSSAPQ